MGRPAKPVAISSGKISKETKNKRKETEEKLRGDFQKVIPPDWLNERQRQVFEYVAGELAGGKIVSNVDVFVLTSFAVAVDRLEDIEKSINSKPDMIFDKSLLKAKARYTADFNTGIKELSLSPQARAKLGGINIVAEKENKDPVNELIERQKKISGAK